jgi:aryl-alcohol dehydrogenase-like predicted oxidoreductase
MEYRKLGNSELKVSEIGLGGSNLGSKVTEEVSIKVINHALEIGINFLDTAALYGQGRSEEVIGKVIKDKRSQIVLATKFGHPRNEAPGESGGSHCSIMKSVETSLKRLNTDYIDLYYMHHPDPLTPVEETLRTLDDLVRSGKVRYIGCSNHAAWQLCNAVWTARMHNLPAFIVVQEVYNLLDRSSERELIPCCETLGVGFVAYAPLASGFLTGKYQRGHEIPAGTKLADPGPQHSHILNDANFDKLAAIETYAREYGHTVGETAISWLLSHPWLSAVIAGASSIEQLSANVTASGLKLTEEGVDRLGRYVPLLRPYFPHSHLSDPVYLA